MDMAKTVSTNHPLSIFGGSIRYTEKTLPDHDIIQEVAFEVADVNNTARFTPWPIYLLLD